METLSIIQAQPKMAFILLHCGNGTLNEQGKNCFSKSTAKGLFFFYIYIKKKKLLHLLSVLPRDQTDSNCLGISLSPTPPVNFKRLFSHPLLSMNISTLQPSLAYLFKNYQTKLQKKNVWRAVKNTMKQVTKLYPRKYLYFSMLEARRRNRKELRFLCLVIFSKYLLLSEALLGQVNLQGPTQQLLSSEFNQIQAMLIHNTLCFHPDHFPLPLPFISSPNPYLKGNLYLNISKSALDLDIQLCKHKSCTATSKAETAGQKVREVKRYLYKTATKKKKERDTVTFSFSHMKCIQEKKLFGGEKKHFLSIFSNTSGDKQN